MERLTIVLLLLALGSASVYGDECEYPYISEYVADSDPPVRGCYNIVSPNTTVTYYEAKAACEADDARLFTFDSVAEFEAIRRRLENDCNFNTEARYWVGAVSDCDWTWGDNGADIPPQNLVWGDDKPSTTGPMCTTMFKKINYRLEDRPCATKAAYICKKDPCKTSPPISNIQHQYYGIFNDPKDNGVIKTFNYIKKRDYTAVQVHFVGNLRGAVGTGAKCNRWFFTFDGVECNDPQKIEWLVYLNTNINLHKHTEFQGMCYGIGSGSVAIGFNVGACPGRTLGDAYTGWSESRIIVTEVDLRENIAIPTCSELSVFNVHHYAYRQQTGDDVVKFYSLTYPKQLEETSIRVLFSGTTRAASTGGCNRWWFTFNGEECKNPSPIDSVIHFSGGTNDNHQTTPFSGFCNNIPAGDTTIDLHTGACRASAIKDSYTGLETSTHIIVQEFRLNNTIDAVSERLLPIFNRMYWYQYSFSDDTDQGVYWEGKYTKHSNTSALRLRFNGNTRVAPGGASGCVQWYFAIDDATCSNPGPIAGKLYSTANLNLHRSGTVAGMCNGVSAGEHTLQLRVGKCDDYALTNAYTGWQSSSFMMAEEVNLGV